MKHYVRSLISAHRQVLEGARQGNGWKMQRGLRQFLEATHVPPGEQESDGNGTVALFEAVDSLNLDAVKWLVEHGGVDVNQQNGWSSWTPLHNVATTTSAHASSPSRIKTAATIAKYLLCKGANPTIKNSAGCTPLHLAAVKGNNALILNMLQHAEDNGISFASIGVSEYSEIGRTPLLYYLCNAHHPDIVQTDVVKALLQAGSDPSSQVETGKKDTALHMVAEALVKWSGNSYAQEYAETLEVILVLLVDAGANPLLTDTDDKTPRDYLNGSSSLPSVFQEMCDYLVEAEEDETKKQQLLLLNGGLVVSSSIN